MKRAEEVMEILEVFDVVGTLRGAAGRLRPQDGRPLDLSARRGRWRVDVHAHAFGGAPTYALTDNDRTVTTDHSAGSRSETRARRRLALLRAHGLNLRSGRPADQGRLGGDGEDRQGRPGAHRPQPGAPNTVTSPSSRPPARRSVLARQRPGAPLSLIHI